MDNWAVIDFYGMEIEVSDAGGIVQEKNGRPTHLKPTRNVGGNVVVIINQGHSRRVRVDKLVFFCFAEHRYKDIYEVPEIYHKDENPYNDHISNLKALNTGEKPVYKMAVRPKTSARVILDALNSGISVSAICKDYGITEQEVKNIWYENK